MLGLLFSLVRCDTWWQQKEFSVFSILLALMQVYDEFVLHGHIIAGAKCAVCLCVFTSFVESKSLKKNSVHV